MNLQALLASASDTAAIVSALISSLATLLIFLAQLTEQGRLKRREQWLKLTLDSEHNSHRREILEEQLQQSRGKVIANLLVPSRKFYGFLFLLFVGPATVVKILLDQSDPTQIFVMVMGYLTFIFWGSRQAIRIYCEKVKVQVTYQAGMKTIKHPDFGILNRMEGGTRREFLFALLIAAEIIGIAYGVALMIKNEPTFGLPLLILGVISLKQSWDLVANYALAQAKAGI